MKKRLFLTLLMACALLTVPVCGLGIGGLRHPALPSVPEDFDYTGSTITSIGSNSGLDTSYTSVFSADSAGLQTLTDTCGRITLPAVVTSAAGTQYALKLSLKWDLDKLHLDSAADQILTGTPILPAGAAVADTVAVPTASMSVRFEQPAAPKTVLLTDSAAETLPGAAAFAVEQGADSASVLARLNNLNWTMTLTDGADAQTEPLPLEWDLGGLDLSSCGVYTVVGRPVVPDGYALAEEFHPTALCTVLVQAAGAPDLTAAVPVDGGNLFPWVQPVCSPEEMSVWMKVAKDPWKQLTEGALPRTDGLFLSVKQAPGVTCLLQVDYPGGHTRQAKITYSDSGSIWVIGVIDGDRDGGDSSGLKPETPAESDAVQPELPATIVIAEPIPTDSEMKVSSVPAALPEISQQPQAEPGTDDSIPALSPADAPESVPLFPSDVPAAGVSAPGKSVGAAALLFRQIAPAGSGNRDSLPDSNVPAPAEKDSASGVPEKRPAASRSAARITVEKAAAPAAKSAVPARVFPIWLPFCLAGLGLFLGGFLLREWRKAP